ncbi:MAG TPA: dephospho-CoA kinase [Mycobacteriales bacterium]|nr:dephospho-CoA kinase [Mycobacteriales bacterium]
MLVGLTGGIGSGKSEVSRRLAALGAVVVDADKIAREVVEVGTPGLAQVVEAFGDDVLAPDGSLDRDAVAARVFGDEPARRRLNAIVHPLVGARTMEQIAAAGEADPHAVVVNDVPLLVEAGVGDRYEVVVVVAAQPETQLRRLLEQRGMSEADARARIAVQAPLEAKLAVADIVITNDGDLESLDAQVKQVWRDLAERAGRTTRG